ncbi:response regulator [Cyanobacterium stanieri LEGE 03274]|uniref:Protein PatA n=1 Tax=Cyanobacterium stanieri LEGE 03274 TaxID=1828756 RepID=A0ABR9V414_9CHRO|nr:response regulator [Cyanobacterium stanieri]MBE9221886.1 response regulator [Cyanobacterium stanieri LEGE 03274]
MTLREKFESSNEKKVTGRLDIVGNKGKTWRIYFCLGRIVWADGGDHPYRSWQRLITKSCPQLDLDLIDLASSKDYECWNYQIIVNLLNRFLINKEQALSIIKSRIIEILFDILYAGSKHNLSYDFIVAEKGFSEESGLKNSLNLFHFDEPLTQAENLWLIWQKEKLTRWSPNTAPIIKNPAILRKNFNTPTYTKLVSLFNGKLTLKEVADRLKLSVVKVTIWLRPYFERDIIELVSVSDTSLNVTLIGVSDNKNYKITKPTRQKLIICVDDSIQICEIMKHIVTKSGYQFIAIQNPLKALPEIITHKPDLIFLDVMMPIINGYEICSQIRRVSNLKHIPIIILTSNDGMVDRVRSKLVGASGFLGKPINEEKVIQKIETLLSNHN